MSSRHGLQSAALGGLIACIGLSAYGQDATKPPSQKPTQTGAAPTKPAAPVPPPKYSAPYKPRCEAPRDHDEASLCEERKATEIALEANEVSRRNFWLSLGGLVALIVTIYYTARATRAADAAAEAAQASVEDARKDAEEQSKRFSDQLKVASDGAAAAMALAKEASKANMIAFDLFVEENRPFLTFGKIGLRALTVLDDGQIQIGIEAILTNDGRGMASKSSSFATANPIFNGIDTQKITVNWMNSMVDGKTTENIAGAHVSGGKPMLFMPIAHIHYSDILWDFADIIAVVSVAVFYTFSPAKRRFGTGIPAFLHYTGPRELLERPGEIDLAHASLQSTPYMEVRS